MDRYAELLTLPDIGYKDLQEWIEDTKSVHPLLIDLHVRLLRRVHKKLSSVTTDRWERGIIKFCDKYSKVDAWEIERFGYKVAKISTKLRLLKNLMECQFDFNIKFKDKINEIPIEEMRFQPIGRDKNGMAYWYFLDKELNLRVYREDQDDVDAESWELVCRCRDDLAKLITGLEYGTDIKLDKQESSDLSEASSEYNDDSRDSFRQKTPLGPSPLTIKQELSDSDGVSAGSKPPILLKVSKGNIQSPSKMLKDKFVKEKGSEIQKIMCKMKEEGLVDSDSDQDNVNTSNKTDEVDGDVKGANQDSDKEQDVKTDSNLKLKQESKEEIEDNSGYDENFEKESNATNNKSKEETCINNSVEIKSDVDSSVKSASDNSCVHVDVSVSDTTDCTKSVHLSSNHTDESAKATMNNESDNSSLISASVHEDSGEQVENNKSESSQNLTTVPPDKGDLSNNIVDLDQNLKDQGSTFGASNENMAGVSETTAICSELVGCETLKQSEPETGTDGVVCNNEKVEEVVVDTEKKSKTNEIVSNNGCESEAAKDERTDESDRVEKGKKFEGCSKENTQNSVQECSTDKESGDGGQTIEKSPQSDNAVENDSQTAVKAEVNVQKMEEKKSRKRKAEQEKGTCSSSTDDEASETLQASKRAVKTAIRKSPSKAEIEDDKQSSQEKAGDNSEQDGDANDPPDNVQGAEKGQEDDLLTSEIKESPKIKNEAINHNDHEKTTENDNNDLVKGDTGKIPKGDESKEISKNTSTEQKDLAREEDEMANEEQTPKKIKGLLANSKKNNIKAKKRQAVHSDDAEPAEPASKRSKLRARVSSKGRGQRRGVTFDSSSSSSEDDLPLSLMAGRGRGNKNTKSKKVGSKQPTAESPKLKKVEEKEAKAADPEIPAEISEDDMGRRRSARVRNMRARKKSPSPDYIPSELEESDEEFLDDEDVEFTLKSKKRKKKEPKEVVEEIPKGRNALRHEEKANKKSCKKLEEEEETPCVKCLRSHQPEWILLCDKCDAGYHTACLRPPLMIIPDGDWFCPPCEHTLLKEKLEENLKVLDQAILKNDRLVRRKERLAFVSISLDNVLKEPEGLDIKPETQVKSTRRKRPNYRESDVESGSESGSRSGSSSESDGSESTSESESSSEGEETHRHKDKMAKQKFVQRSCRAKKSVSYRFEEFDELIMDAIEEDLSIPKEPKPKKVKPPGISRGKDMSNILGVSDDEKEKKPPRKRKPRLTELDEEVDDDDDTDDYQLSEDSNATDLTKSSEGFESEVVSEDSIGSSWRYNSRSTRRSQRKGGGRNRKYRDDFVVDSDFESEEDSGRRSTRRSKRNRVNYREINSDETEIEDNDESFHSSELSDSDFEIKRKKRKEKMKKEVTKERPRSGKRQRIRRVSSSESTEEESDESTPKKKSGKKPPTKTARYDDVDSDESITPSKTKKSAVKKSQNISDMSEESDAEETENTEYSDNSEVEKKVVKKKDQKKKKLVVKSDSEEEKEAEEEDGGHSDSNTSETGWEEISIGSGDEQKARIVDSINEETQPGGEKPDDKQETHIEMLEKKQPEQGKVSVAKSQVKGKKGSPKKEAVSTYIVNKVDSQENDKINDISECVTTNENRDTNNLIPDSAAVEDPPDMSATVSKAEQDSSTPKKRARKPKAQPENNDVTTSPEITPKKRGRKPKPKPDPTETGGEEIPVKKKRGRKSKSDVATDEVYKNSEVDEKESKSKEVDETKPEEDTNIPSENVEKSEKPLTDKAEQETSQASEKVKDDSPLSARSKQNAPVGVVKPEVRQGVIVENRQVIDSRVNETRDGESGVNPLQGMRDLAMGNQNAAGHHQSSFTPYSQSSFGNQNMPPGYMGQQGFQNYPHHAPHLTHSGPMPSHTYPGSHSIPASAPSQSAPPTLYPPNQGPMSPGSYPHHPSPYMGPMQQGPPGYYPGSYRHPRPEGMGPPGPHGPQSPPYQQGQFPPSYHPHQGPYQGHPGYPDHPPPYQMSHQQGSHVPYPSMPYNYPNMPSQVHPSQGYGPVGPPPQNPNHPFRPHVRHLAPPSVPPSSRSSPSSRGEGSGETPNRGFMMDNILKPSTEALSNDVEDSAEVSDIDRYTSFLCKSE